MCSQRAIIVRSKARNSITARVTFDPPGHSCLQRLRVDNGYMLRRFLTYMYIIRMVKCTSALRISFKTLVWIFVVVCRRFEECFRKKKIF